MYAENCFDFLKKKNENINGAGSWKFYTSKQYL